MLRVTANTQLMKEIVDLLSVLTEEAKLVWKENGLHINVVDGSHVALTSSPHRAKADRDFDSRQTDLSTLEQLPRQYSLNQVIYCRV